MTSLVRYIKTLTLLWGVLLLSAVVSFAQSEKIFSISEFVQDPFDLSGRGDTTKMVDGSGYLYSIVKVSSDDPEDKLSDYRFDFGMLKSIVKVVDGELWVYVQKNAKQVSVSRQGYKTVHRFDLGYTLESGAVYRMKISVKKEAVGKAMLQFKITPAKSGIAIMYTNASGKEGLFGITDDSGSAVKYLELGTYTYKVVADMYHPSEGYISLKTRNEVFVEDVVLRANYAEVELLTSSGVDIFIDGQIVGKSSWSGALNPGNYTVECRLANHKTTTRIIEVKDGEKYKFQLDSPVPIVGTLILASTPLGAAVQIDGKYLGVTPLVLDNLLIGAHTIEISHSNYTTKTKTVVVKEGEGLEENIVLEKVASQSNNAIVGGGSQANSSGKGVLMFQITPAKAGIMVTYTNSDGVESLFGITNENGQVARYIELGIYTFSVVAEYYHKSEGRVKLESKNGTHIEEVVLRPNFADVELVAASGADIYVDGQKKGTSSWKGILGPGTYQIECRRENHRSTSKYVEVKDGEQYKFTLDAPVPIVGTLVLMSSPLGATVKIDNKEYGKTPLTIDNILIGSHTVSISMDKYEPQTKTIIIKEGETIEENVVLVAAKSQSSSVAVTGSKSGTINGHEYVDLGLPSGLKWATCNVGASSPEEYGDYYVWGEIETKGEYTKDNSKTRGKSMSDISGNAMYDVARSKWGGSWRIPTKEEYKELINSCKWEWTIQNGKNGYMVTGPNGNSIFLPAAGYRDGSSLYYEGGGGFYWSSTPYRSNDGGACYLGFASSGRQVYAYDCYDGRSVRPVLGNQNESNKINGYEYVDLGLPSGLKWATCNVGSSSPEEYGDYYAWGEIDAKSKYDESNSKTYGKSMSEISGNSTYDVARAKWGGSWRLPTKEEFKELIQKCKWEWTTINGKKGYKVTGPNGKSIFLPAAGYRGGSPLYGAGWEGDYWGSTPKESNDSYAISLDFNSSNHDRYWGYRYSGQSVRPVSE